MKHIESDPELSDKVLNRIGINYVEISGNWEERFEKSIETINFVLNIKSQQYHEI